MNDTLLLRFLAILLITNSHLERMYPIPWLAAGGQWGNSLFFMLSGLGLTLSSMKNTLPPFWTWLEKRLSRIYPSVWLVVLIFPVLLQSSWRVWGLGDYLYHFLYPTIYWFISALLVFYLAVYPILRYRWQSRIPLLIFLVLIPYFYFYWTALDLSRLSVESAGLFKWLPYFQILLFGMWLAPVYKKWKEEKLIPTWRDWGWWFLVCMAYIVLKVLVGKGVLTQWQFLLQWLMFPFVYFSLKLVQHPKAAASLKWPVAGFLIRIMATATLEIYLLQHDLYLAPWILALGFPLNAIVFWLILVPAAYGIYLLGECLRSFFQVKPSAEAKL